MKKFLFFVCFILLIQGQSFASEIQGAVVKTSKVQVFSESGKFGLKDNETIIVKPEFKKMIRLGNTSWIVQKKDRFGLIDNSGNYLIKPKYRHCDRVYRTYVKFGNDNDYGLYDQMGQIIIPPKYSKIDPLFGKMFLTYKDYKYGIVDFNGKILLNNDFDDIYMPDAKTMRIQYEGYWFEIERMASNEIILPSNVQKITVDNNNFKITRIMANAVPFSGYSALTLGDYSLKLFSSISPSYEQTIDELMFSQGAEAVSIFVKLGWLPRFPYTYIKKYCNNVRTPNNGPLSEARYELKKQIK